MWAPKSSLMAEALAIRKSKPRRMTMDEFQKTLKAGHRTLRHLNKVRYAHVTVLALYFENAFGVTNWELRRLITVLSESYGFIVELYEIPLRGVSRTTQLEARLNDFAAKWDRPGNLTIYIYCGGGVEEPPKYASKYDEVQGQVNGCQVAKLRIFDESIHEEKLYWPDIHKLVNFQAGDVLYIFDPISASQIALRGGPETIAFSNPNPGAASCTLDDFTEKLFQLRGQAWAVSHMLAEMHRDALAGKIAAPPTHVAHPSKPSVVLQKWAPPLMNPLSATRVVMHVELRDAERRGYWGWREWMQAHIDDPDMYGESHVRVVAQYEGNLGSTTHLHMAVPHNLWALVEGNDGYERID